MDYYKITADSENYEEKLAEAKTYVESQFTSTYWFELVAYDYLMKEMIANADVTYTAQ